MVPFVELHPRVSGRGLCTYDEASKSTSPMRWSSLVDRNAGDRIGVHPMLLDTSLLLTVSLHEPLPCTFPLLLYYIRERRTVGMIS